MGYFIVFKVNQSLIRSDIRAMINSGFQKEMLIVIKIDNPGSDPNFKKLDHNEFSYCGRLYDIAGESVKGKTVWYYCINDKHEEQLIAGFEKIQSYSSPFGSHQNSKYMLALRHNLVTLALLIEPSDSSKPDLSDINFCQYSYPIVNTGNCPVSPPPELS